MPGTSNTAAAEGAAADPEIGCSVDVGGIATNYHDVGEGAPVLFIHGSGPGVSAWANWRLNLPAISAHGRCLAPDIVGFGHTVAPDGFEYTMANWVAHLGGFVDALDLGPVAIVGNSFGGALATAFAVARPESVRALVLMGSVGVDFELTEGLDAVWGYEPSVANMRALLDVFTSNERFATDELAELRYRASVREGVQESYAAMFPAPRQRWIDAMASDPEAVRGIRVPALVVHGRDDRVIPVANAHRFFELLPNAELHLFPNCGHWTQIERRTRFDALVGGFLDALDDG